jgi:integrase/recombinase XerD
MTALTDAADGYLKFRRAFGHDLSAHAKLLNDFVGYLDAAGDSTITIDVALAWASAPTGVTPARIANRLSVVRKFATYLSAFDPATQVPPVNLVRAGSTRRAPYIFTTTEVAALMTAATRLSPPLRASSYTTLIGLMAATGLRTTEAVRLDRGDLNLHAGLLLVRHTKYGKTRQIPLHPSTTCALTDYSRHRDRLCPRPVADTFLISPTGQRLSAVGHTFGRLLCEVGISVPAGRRAPRLHDLRHSFAVATLRDWHAAGLDVQAQLPVLSTYLGHVNPANTYWYLQAVPELMAVLADRLTGPTGDQP